MSPLSPTLETVHRDHFIQSLLCRDLEAVADGLPDTPDVERVRALCERIERITSCHFARAEQAFADLPGLQRPTDAALDMLHDMHLLDEIHAQDLVAALTEHASRFDETRVGQLAYMLRCFFDGCRRLIALKESWIANAELTQIRSDWPDSPAAPSPEFGNREGSRRTR